MLIGMGVINRSSHEFVSCDFFLNNIEFRQYTSSLNDKCIYLLDTDTNEMRGYSYSEIESIYNSQFVDKEVKLHHCCPVLTDYDDFCKEVERGCDNIAPLSVCRLRCEGILHFGTIESIKTFEGINPYFYNYCDSYSYLDTGDCILNVNDKELFDKLFNSEDLCLIQEKGNLIQVQKSYSDVSSRSNVLIFKSGLYCAGLLTHTYRDISILSLHGEVVAVPRNTLDISKICIASLVDSKLRNKFTPLYGVSLEDNILKIESIFKEYSINVASLLKFKAKMKLAGIKVRLGD